MKNASPISAMTIALLSGLALSTAAFAQSTAQDGTSVTGRPRGNPAFGKALVCYAALFSENIRLGLFMQPIGAEKDEPRLIARRDAWEKEVKRLMPSDLSDDAFSAMFSKSYKRFMTAEAAADPRLLTVINGCGANAPGLAGG